MKHAGTIARHVCAPEAYDIVIRNGKVFEGLRMPRFLSDIGILGGKLATMGGTSKDATCAKEIDATGMHVCLGTT